MSPAQKTILFSAVFFSLFLGQAHAQVRLRPEEAEKLLIEKPEPLYPAVAKAARTQGVVRIEITVSERGVVASANAVSGHPLLRAAALSAVKRWKYKANVVGDKPISFVTSVSSPFSPHSPTSEKGQDYGQQEQLDAQYFKEEDKCRSLVKGQRWKEAEVSCKSALRMAEQLSDDRALEKMTAYEQLGHALMGQRRYQEALGHYHQALVTGRAKLTEKDGEVGQLYGEIAIAHHLLRDLSKAREFYRKSESSYQLAISHIDDEIFENQYLNSLKKILGYHLIAAEQGGEETEVEEIKNLMKSLP